MSDEIRALLDARLRSLEARFDQLSYDQIQEINRQLRNLAQVERLEQFKVALRK